jgi:hypothetical protein
LVEARRAWSELRVAKRLLQHPVRLYRLRGFFYSSELPSIEVKLHPEQVTANNMVEARVWSLRAEQRR